MTEQATAVESVDVTESTAPKTAAELSQAIKGFLAESFGLEATSGLSPHGEAFEVSLEGEKKARVGNGRSATVVVMSTYDWFDVEERAKVIHDPEPACVAALRTFRERLTTTIESIRGVTNCGIILDGQGGGAFQFTFNDEALRIRLDPDPVAN